jgi:hypothetical protein
MSEVNQANLTAIVPARVLAVDTTAPAEGARAVGIPTDAFFFEAEISSTTLDSYFTHMADSTLRNFARDAAEGVSLLDSHDGFKLGVGYSAGGRYEEEDGAGRVVATFYIVPGINYGGRHSFAASDDFIRAIRSGVVRDVSVGFYGGRWVCDLCKQPYFGQGSTCQHLAGWEYESERDGRLAREMCTVAIYDARLSEVSLVYDGATPGAMILKAEQEAEAGRMSVADIRQFEQQYRVKLPRPSAGAAPLKVSVTTDPVRIPTTLTTDSAASWTIPAPAGTQGVRTMHEDEEVVAEEVAEIETPVVEAGEPAADTNADAEARTAVEEVRAAMLESAAPQGATLAAGVRWLNDQLVQATRQLNEAQAEIARLQPLADQGRAYRDELVNQAVAEGVRAMGEAFPEETYRAMLTGAPLEHIRQVRDTFAAQGDARFPGGRQTVDLPTVDDNKPQRETPLAAYGVK